MAWSSVALWSRASTGLPCTTTSESQEEALGAVNLSAFPDCRPDTPRQSGMRLLHHPCRLRPPRQKSLVGGIPSITTPSWSSHPWTPHVVLRSLSLFITYSIEVTRRGENVSTSNIKKCGFVKGTSVTENPRSILVFLRRNYLNECNFMF